jgi:hypothetical protein
MTLRLLVPSRFSNCCWWRHSVKVQFLSEVVPVLNEAGNHAMRVDGESCQLLKLCTIGGRGIKCEYEALVERCWQSKTEAFIEKPPSVPLCLTPQPSEVTAVNKPPEPGHRLAVHQRAFSASLGTIRKWVASLKRRPLYSRSNSSRYLCVWNWVGPKK